MQSMVIRRQLSMCLLFCARPYQDIDFRHTSVIAFSQPVWLVLISLDIHNNTSVLSSVIFMPDSGFGGT